MATRLTRGLYLGYFCSSLHKAYPISGLSAKQRPSYFGSKRPDLHSYSILLHLEHHAFLCGIYLHSLYALQKNPTVTLVTLVLACGTMSGTGKSQVCTIVHCSWQLCRKSSHLSSKQINQILCLRLIRSFILNHHYIAVRSIKWLNNPQCQLPSTLKVVHECNTICKCHCLGRIVIEGDFDLHTRAASKYDDRRVLHLPALKLW